MKKRILTILLLAGCFVAAIPQGAHAQFLLDQAVSSSIGAGTELGAAARPPATPAMIMQNLQKQGYTNIQASPSIPGQYTANAAGGIPLVLTVEPKTGKLLSAVPQQ